MAKIEYFRDRNKLVVWFFRRTDMIPVDRQSRTAGSDLEDAAKILLEKEKVLAIFPEGTRSKSGKLARVRGGGIKVSRSTKAPIAPVGIVYTPRASPSRRELAEHHR